MDIALVPPNELYIMWPKIVEVTVFVIMAFMVKRRGGKTLRDAYALNLTLFVGFIAWAVYIGTDTILFLTAAQSFNLAVPINQVTGYPAQYPSLFFAQVLRDISMFGGYTNMWCLFVAAFIIRHGVQETRKRLTRNPIFLGNIIAYGIFFIATDGIYVSILPGPVVVVNAVWQDLSLLPLTITIGIYSITALYFWWTSTRGIYTAEVSLQRRVKRLGFAVFLIALVLIYWLVQGVLQSIFPVLLQPSISTLMGVIGHGVWTLAPILMFLALREPRSMQGKEEVLKLDNDA